MKNLFTKADIILWCSSIILIIGSFMLFSHDGYLNLCASLVGVTALIFIAKGNPIGQLLTVFFSIMYGIISYSCRYYGEMITYLGMTAPMAVIALITWLKNPYGSNKTEVKVRHFRKKDIPPMLLITAAVTAAFYFILSFFNTANIVPSTISVATSFLAVYLTYKRSEFYAVAYAANDIVLIILWSLAAMNDISYISVVVCFIIFFANDIYGFISWSKMKKRQNENISEL